MSCCSFIAKSECPYPAIRSRHLSRLPEDSTMRLFSCLQWFFEHSAFLLVDGFLPRTTLLQCPCRLMRLLEMVTFSSVVKQSLSACLGGVMVCADPDCRSVGASFRFFLAFGSAHGHCPVRSVPIVHFCLEVCLGLVPGQANMQNRFAMICCHRPVGVPFRGISGLLPFRVHESTG